MKAAIYNPDSAALDSLLARLPGGLRGYGDHARLFLHFGRSQGLAGGAAAS